MTNKNVYTKKNLRIIRIISLAILILISITTPLKMYGYYQEMKVTEYTIVEAIMGVLSIALNILLITTSAILVRYPQKFFIIGIVALAYSLGMSLWDSEAIMSLLMLCVTFSTLLLRSNFTREKKKIIIIFAFIYLLELLFPLRQGLDVFLTLLTQKAGTSLLLGIIFFFSFEYTKQISNREASKDKVLNLAAFKGLERSDMYLLKQVLDNKKYKEIADSIHGSEGALRNKLSKIYKVLEVGDRIGFLTIYSGYELIYEPEQSETVTN